MAERLALLKDAAWLIQGRFVDGCESEWIHAVRIGVGIECLKVLEELLWCQQEGGHLDETYETAQQILSFDPENAVARRALLTSALPVTRFGTEKDRQNNVEAIVTMSTLPHSSDRQSSEAMLKIQIGRLPLGVLPSLYALAVFPAPFTARHAREIAGVSLFELERFTDHHLLQRPGEDRFVVLEPIRQVLWRKLTGEQRRRLLAGHARWFGNWASHVHANIRSPQEAESASIALSSESLHLESAFAWTVRHKPDLIGTEFFIALWSRLPPFSKRILDHRDYFVGFCKLQTIEELSVDYLFALILIASHFDDKSLFNSLSAYLIKNAHDFSSYELVYLLSSGMSAAHNNGDDNIFDSLHDFLKLTVDKFHNIDFENKNEYIIAENYLARNRFSEALVMNDACLSFFRRVGTNAMLAAAFYQRGCILNGLKRTVEARASWNIALETFEASDDTHGIADCLHSLAILYTEDGALSEASRGVSQAIALYQQCGDHAAVVAAGGTLGDILLKKGDVEKARLFYKEGLAFWKERQHPRWIDKFEKRLQMLYEQND